MYLVLFDIKGAFDNVSQRQPMQGLRKMGVDVGTRRIVRNRLASRTFQVEVAIPKGTCRSSTYPITKGLPQGGAPPLSVARILQPDCGVFAMTTAGGAIDESGACRLYLYR